jgi:hypothetical protein
MTMTDPDRDRESVRDTERTTTVVQTDGGRGGGSGLIIAIVLIVALLALLFFLFGGLNRAGDEVGVNVDVEAPELSVPDEIKVDVPDKIEVDVPDVEVKEGNSQ